MKPKIDRNITIKELIEIIPDAIRYFENKGITCILCSEPLAGTIDSVCKGYGFNELDIQRFVKELNLIDY